MTFPPQDPNTEPTPAPADQPPAPDTTPQPESTPAPEPTPQPASAPAADVGDVISYQLDPDDDSTAARGLVVGTVDGAEHREEGLLVVPLADALVIPLDAVKD